jgi:hypothetical protein
MSNRHFDEAHRLIGLSPAVAYFHGGKSETAIRMAQEILQTPFPESYLSFLREFGCGQVAAHELYGLVDENCQAEGVPNVVWVTLEERRLGLPPTYVVIEAFGDGALFCLETSRLSDARECPVLNYIPGSAATPDHLAENFGKYFLECVHEALMDAKAGSSS